MVILTCLHGADERYVKAVVTNCPIKTFFTRVRIWFSTKHNNLDDDEDDNDNEDEDEDDGDDDDEGDNWDDADEEEDGDNYGEDEDDAFVSCRLSFHKVSGYVLAQKLPLLLIIGSVLAANGCAPCHCPCLGGFVYRAFNCMFSKRPDFHGAHG
jgi:hypothetical protein